MLGLGMYSGHCSRPCLAWCTALRSSCWCVSVWGIGEAPMNPCGVKVINDWFNIKERGRPMGFFNAASTQLALP